MITEQELELALALQKEIRDLNVLIAKLEESKVSRSDVINTTINMGNSKIEVSDYTQHILQKFKDDIVCVHKIQLKDLKVKYAEIIESPDDTLIRILEENG